MEHRPIRVAVIGAGMSGLVAARELQRENHNVVVFERSTGQIGGTWVYDPKTETDPMSLDPTREIVHSSMYDSLRTNVPRQLMGFLDYPMTKKEGGDPRTFPGRAEVLRFLNDFAADFDLVKLVRFGSDVVRVEPVAVAGGRSSSWVVEWRTKGAAVASTEEIFEAVVVCVGHHTEPRITDFPGRSRWPGKQVHSHNYRIPEPYKDQIVLIIGNGPSAMDISKDIFPFAKQLHQSTRANIQNPDKLHFKDTTTILKHPVIKCAEEDGKLVFEDGSSLYADVILHCTGYRYHYPFLRINNVVTVDDNRVGPLYKHVFPPSLAPNLSFIGLTYLGLVPLMVELQSRWVARVLSGKVMLPSEEQMMESVQQDYKEMEEMGVPKHHSHLIQLHTKFGYQKWLANASGLPPFEKWREEMFLNLITIYVEHGENFRDELDGDKWLQEFEQQELSNN